MINTDTEQNAHGKRNITGLKQGIFHMKQETDDAILGMLLERNEAALEQIQSAYGKLCYKLADDILNNREDSEECVNDMLLKVWRTIPPKHPDSLLAYVITIIRNAAGNKYLAMKFAGIQISPRIRRILRMQQARLDQYDA